jgi:hypothetical protein
MQPGGRRVKGQRPILSVAQSNLNIDILRHMKVEEIAEAVAKLPPGQLARFRRWFTAFEDAPITLRSSTPVRLNSVASPAVRLLS